VAICLVELLLVLESLSLRDILVKVLVEETLTAVLRVRTLAVAHALPFSVLGAGVDDSPRRTGLEASELVCPLALVSRLYAAPVRRFVSNFLFDLW